jgi:phospholipase/carboxylesterase
VTADPGDAGGAGVSSAVRCAFCNQKMAYVHGHAGCVRSGCAMFAVNQAECCDGETAEAAPAQTSEVAAVPASPSWGAARLRATTNIVCVMVLVGCRADPAPPQQRPTAEAAAPVPEDVPPCSPPGVRVIGPAEGPADTTLIMLHGYGANAADIEPAARVLAGAGSHLVVLVPDGCDPSEGAPGRRKWWDFRRGADPTRASNVRTASIRVSRFVDAELQRRALPRDRVVWAGFSQGAMISQWMAVHATPRPLAVVSFSGRFDDDTPIGAPVGTSVLLVHGGRDAMIPFAKAERAEQALVARGAKVERVDRPAMGHSIDRESLAAAVAFLARNLGTP